MIAFTSNPLLRLWKRWLTPRTIDPTIIYRERALRVILPIVFLLRFWSASNLYSGNPSVPVPSVSLLIHLASFIIPLLFSTYFLIRQKVDEAGICFLVHWYLLDMYSLPAEGYWYPGYQISIILQGVVGTLLLPSRVIIPFMLFQLTTIGIWGNWLDRYHFDPPLLSSGQPVAVFRTTILTLAAQESIIVFTVRYLRMEMERSLRLQHLTIKQLHEESDERQQTELALRESETRYRSLLENIPAITYLTAVGREPLNPTLYMSPQILKLSNHSSEEFIDDPQLWIQLIHPDDRERVIAESERSDQTGEALVVRYRIVDAEHRTLWIQDENVIVRDDRNKPLYRLGIWTDITKLKSAEEVQDKLIGELEQRNAELERLAYTLSHELKSPLITIRGFLGYLLDDAAKGNIQRLERDVERITDGTDKMVRLINELIALMMIGRIVHEPRELSLRALVDEAVGLLQDQIPERNIALQIMDDLPNAHGDPRQLMEVFLNLIENSVKFMGEQTQPRIEIGTRYEESGAPVFYIRDNGMGLEPRFTERIFGIFQKLDARSEGTGIGLALVKRIIEVHGGKIWAESDGLLKGSTFCFTLPVDGKNRTEP